jgi:hypothetical protein
MCPTQLTVIALSTALYGVCAIEVWLPIIDLSYAGALDVSEEADSDKILLFK